MSSYRLLKHRQYDNTAGRLPQTIQHKAMWSQVLLGTRGRTPNVKSTTGYNARWRRTPVQGYHYYLWWIPLSESTLADTGVNAEPGHTILVHSIRHHDETDDPIDLRSLDEFEEVRMGNLDPRFAEQRAVGERLLRQNISVATIKGLPGSGKTISLFYLVRDLASQIGLQNILYVTYTTRLKRAAREFLAAQGPAFEQHVRVRTFGETLGDLLGTPVPHSDPFGDLRDFVRYLEMQQPATLGAWRKYPETLYTELRAYLFGRMLPEGYVLPDGPSARAFFPSSGLTALAYAAARGIDPSLAELAVRLADRLRNERFFLDQRQAARALSLLKSGKLPGWLRELDALIVDEVQDLTLLQTTLLGELARTRLRRRPDAPLVMAVAGDESQIVQPSGFDWGESKDLLRDLMGVNPIEFEFRHQRRSPRNLALLIDNSWSLYSYLPKTLRPSANRQTFVDDTGAELSHRAKDSAPDDENGRILICPLPDEAKSLNDAGLRRWEELIATLAELPGRALIDLSETIVAALPSLGEKAGEVVFLAREIKGLERGTVVVHGLNRAYQAAVYEAEEAGDNLPRLEARRVFDEIRVALSRSTDKLILLEPPSAAVLTELQINRLDGCYTVGWESLLEMLKSEEMSEIEVVEGYLDETDDLLERGRWEQARRRNRRAFDFAVQLEDRALLREADEQFIRSYLGEANDLLAHDRLRDAYVLNRQAFDLADAHGDPQVIDEVDEQQREIRTAVARKVDALVATAHAAASQQDYALAYQIAHTSTDLLTIMQDPTLQAKLDEAAVAYGWQWGIHLLSAGPEVAERLPELFKSLSTAMQRQSDLVGAQVAQVIAERYRTIAHGARLTQGQVTKLIRYIDHYLGLLAPLTLDASAFVFVEHWLEEAFAPLGDDAHLYYEWSIMAQTYAALNDYPSLDERLWELENRTEVANGPQWKVETTEEHLLRFAALIAGYNGEAAAASVAWEKLGQIDMAANQAREAGDIERAYHLLRSIHNTQIPEELSIAVKLLRLVEQLQAKHTRLQAAERRVLAEHLAALAAVLAAEVEAMEDGA